ncbi:MAG: hypothetical protein AAGI46_00780 [Planctomycetota bacterium]
MTLAAVAPVLVAASDLALVRLIRDAIAKPEPFHPDKTHPADADGPDHPSHPSAINDGPDATRTIQETNVVYLHDNQPLVVSPETPIGPAVAPLPGPMPAPWQLLLREQVWNRPVEAPPVPELLDHAQAAARYGLAATTPSQRLVDAFL